MPADELMKTLADYLKQYNPEFYENTFIAHDEAFNRAVITEVQKRCETLADFPALSECFYQEPEVDTALLLSEKMGVTSLEQAKEALQFGLDIIKSFTSTPSRDQLKDAIIPKIAEAGKKNGQILWPLRVALTGKEFSPGAFEMTEILGLEKAIARIERVIAKIV